MNSIKLGDRVRFLNENLEGIVTSIKGSNAGVTIEDDFEIPVPISQLVKVAGMQNNLADDTIENPINKDIKANQGIYIAFDRMNDVLLDLKLYNSDSEELLFAFYEENKQGIQLKKSGKLVLNETVELGRYDLEKFSTWPQFHFQIIQINKQPDKLLLPINYSIIFNAKEFHASFKHTFFSNRQSYLFKINDDKIPPIDLRKLQEKDFTEKQEVQISFDKKPAPIIDLHIEKLVANVSSLNPTEMISLQMEAFTKSLEMAHVHKMKSIVFIHGVGNHFLKNKIRNYLGLQKQLVVSYHDADTLKFGGGATEVYLN
jgi:hypothetical protein